MQIRLGNMGTFIFGTKWDGGVARHYKTMNIKDIINMKDKIKKLAADNCLLFMWVTFPNLKQGLKVIEEWGFIYKTLGFSWIKTNKKNGKPFFGIGFYTKSNCEVCLIGIKGKPGKLIKSNKISCLEKHRRLLSFRKIALMMENQNRSPQAFNMKDGAYKQKARA